MKRRDTPRHAPLERREAMVFASETAIRIDELVTALMLVIQSGDTPELRAAVSALQARRDTLYREMGLALETATREYPQ